MINFVANIIRNSGVSEIRLWQVARFLRLQEQDTAFKVADVLVSQGIYYTKVVLPEPYQMDSIWFSPEEAIALAQLLVEPEAEAPTSWNPVSPELFKTGPNIFWNRHCWPGDVWGNYPPNNSLDYYGTYSKPILPQGFGVLSTAAMLLTDVPYVRGGCAWWVDISPCGGDYVDLFPELTREYNEEFLRSCGDPFYIWTAECGEDEPVYLER